MEKINLDQTTGLNHGAAPNAMRANDRASKANKHARIARNYRNKAIELNRKITDWKQIMSGSPVVLFTCCFIIFCASEILYSWEMYREFLGAFFGNPHWIIVLMLGLVIVFIAGYVSHLLSKVISSNEFDLEVYNYLHISKKDLILEYEAIEYVNAEKKKDLLWGIIGMFFILTVVAFISWQRTFLMSEATGVDDYSLIQKVFPVIIVLLEILTGIYIGLYLIPLIIAIYQKRKAQNNYSKNLTICSIEDKMVTALLEQAKLHSEAFTLTKELADSIYRIKNRSMNSENYEDKINLKQLEITITGLNNQPVPNIHIIGVVPSNKSVIGGISNSNGHLFLYWESQDNHLERLIVNNALVKDGPFMANTAYVVLLDESLELTS